MARISSQYNKNNININDYSFKEKKITVKNKWVNKQMYKKLMNSLKECTNEKNKKHYWINLWISTQQKQWIKLINSE